MHAYAVCNRKGAKLHLIIEFLATLENMLCILTLDVAFHVLDYIVHYFSYRQLADLEYKSNDILQSVNVCV